MKYSRKLSDAIHILVYISTDSREKPSSAKIAESVNTNPSYIRQIMAALSKAGIISATKGAAKPRLCADPEKISMLDIYRAVEGEKPLLHLDVDTNPRCGVAINVQYAIGDCYKQVQKAAEDAMRQITLARITRDFNKRVAEHEKMLSIN